MVAVHAMEDREGLEPSVFEYVIKSHGPSPLGSPVHLECGWGIEPLGVRVKSPLQAQPGLHYPRIGSPPRYRTSLAFALGLTVRARHHAGVVGNKNWSSRLDWNQRPHPYQGRALPC